MLAVDYFKSLIENGEKIHLLIELKWEMMPMIGDMKGFHFAKSKIAMLVLFC